MGIIRKTLLLATILSIFPIRFAYSAEFNFVTLEYPPLEYAAHEDGSAEGVAVDIVRKIMANLGHSVSIRVLPWTRAMQMVKSGNADAIFTIFKNPEREEFLNFSEEVLISQMVFFYKKKGAAFEYNGNISSIKGLRIGVVSTISYGEVFDRYRPLVKIERVNKLEHNLIKLIKGRIDLVPNSYDVAEYTIQKLGLTGQIERLPQMIESLPSYIAYSKTKALSSLRKDIDAEIKKMKKNGQYLDILKKYGLHIYQ